MKIRLRDIELTQLNNLSLTLVSKYARLLRTTEGTQLKLNDKDILVKISESARQTDNDELVGLYKELKEQIRVGVFDSMKN